MHSGISLQSVVTHLKRAGIAAGIDKDQLVINLMGRPVRFALVRPEEESEDENPISNAILKDPKKIKPQNPRLANAIGDAQEEIIKAAEKMKGNSGF